MLFSQRIFCGRLTPQDVGRQGEFQGDGEPAVEPGRGSHAGSLRIGPPAGEAARKHSTRCAAAYNSSSPPTASSRRSSAASRRLSADAPDRSSSRWHVMHIVA